MQNLNPINEEKVLAIFKQMDTDGSLTIEKEEATKFWQYKFAKL